MIHIVVADDEVLARQKLRRLLAGETDLEVVGEGTTASETIELVRLVKPDLLFLDIRMPGMDGFEVIDRLSADGDAYVPRIIFTTAYDRYALRAFEIRAVDYLLKPFTKDRLRSALDRVREEIAAPVQRPAGANTRTNGGTGSYMSRIVFKSRGRILFLPVSEIRWIGAEENYVRISAGAETHLLRETMARIEEQLDPNMFLRVHRSAIVNLQYVKEVRTESGGEHSVVLVNGQKVAMSRSYRSRVSDLLVRS
jgi:two-component system, LytTR family, response regulator